MEDGLVKVFVQVIFCKTSNIKNLMKTSENYQRIAEAKSYGDALYRTLYKEEMTSWLYDGLNAGSTMVLRVGLYTIYTNRYGVTEYLHEGDNMVKVNEEKCDTFTRIAHQLYNSFWKGIRTTGDWVSDPYVPFTKWLNENINEMEDPEYRPYVLEAVDIAHREDLNGGRI